MSAPNHFQEALALTRPDYLANIRESMANRAAYIGRMADAACDWAKKPDSEWAQLDFLDALSFCGFDVSDEMADLQHDLSIDAEGFPLDDVGYRKEGADRRWMPLGKIVGGIV